MATVRSEDALLYYEVSGSGHDLILLHPFPLNHHFWNAIVPTLSARYRVITPDLRGHGDSKIGEGPATMANHAADLHALCAAAGIAKAIFVGVSIGGYVLFEFWRRQPERFAAVVFSNTRAEAETPEGHAGRLRTADEVLRNGAGSFFEGMLQKLLSATTRTERPDIVEAARHMMQKMSPENVAGVLRGMADRPDSLPTLSTINIPALVIAGAEDSVPLSDLEHICDGIAGSKLHVVESAGHYAAMEKPQEYSRVLLSFADGVYS